MKIWWGFRFAMEGFLLFGTVFFFMSPGGYVFNVRKRYVFHKQKRERSKLTISFIINSLFQEPLFLT